MVRFGVFENFKGRTTLLIWGDDAGLAELRAAFADFARSKRSALVLNNEPWAEVARDGLIDFVLTEAEHGTIQLSFSHDVPRVTLRCTSEEFARFADQLKALASPLVASGHQYLDLLGPQSLQVMVSRGEYPLEV